MRGFTLVELVVTLFVASLLLAVATSAFILQNRIGSSHGGTQAAQMAGQVSQDFLERDLRMAGYRTDRASALSLVNNAPATDTEAMTGSDKLFVAYSTTAASRYLWYVAKEGGLVRKNMVSGVVEPVAREIDDLQAVLQTLDPATGAVSLQLFLVSRSPKQDPQFVMAPPRPLDSPARPADHYRRRVFATTVVPRNFGL